MAKDDILCQLLIIVKVPAGYADQAKIHRQISQDCSPVIGETRVKQAGGDVILFTTSTAVYGSEMPGLAHYAQKLSKLFSTDKHPAEFHIAYLTETRVVLLSDKETYDTDVFVGSGKYASAVGVCRPHGRDYQWKDTTPAYFPEASDFINEAKQKFISNQVSK